MEGEKKKTKELKYSVVMVTLSPYDNLIPSKNIALLLNPCSPQIQVVDPGDGGSSNRKSTKFDKATKKTIEIEKGLETSTIIS